MTTAFFHGQPIAPNAVEALRERRAAVEAALVEAADQFIADRQRLNEAIRQTESAMRRQHMAILATIEAQSRLPILAGPLMHMAPVVGVGYHMLRLRPGC